MGKLNFRGYLISRFILLAKFAKIWCTRKICVWQYHGQLQSSLSKYTRDVHKAERLSSSNAKVTPVSWDRLMPGPAWYPDTLVSFFDPCVRTSWSVLQAAVDGGDMLRDGERSTNHRAVVTCRDGTGSGFLTRDLTRSDPVSSLNDVKSRNVVTSQGQSARK